MFSSKQVLQFIKVFQEKDFVFSIVYPPVERDGYWTPAHDELSKPASDFLKALHKSGAIDPKFMDKTVVSDERSYQLRNSMDQINSASLFELAHVLTFLMRAERFSPGTITAAYNNGIIKKILQRLSLLTSNSD